MARLNPYENHYRHTVPMPDVSTKVLSNGKKLIDAVGKITMNCDNCAIEYETQACWAKRTNNHFCSHSCKGEYQAIEISKECSVCGSGFTTNPTTYFRYVTCSKNCLKIDRIRKANIQHGNT